MPKTFTRPPRLWKRMVPGAALLLIQELSTADMLRIAKSTRVAGEP